MLTQYRSAAKPCATVEDLYAAPEDGKAELVNGELVLIPATGARPGRVSGKIAVSLMAHEAEHGGGFAFGDSVGFLVNLPERESFSPDAAWYVGPADVTEAMEFLPHAPALAVEVRSKNDYGTSAERAIADKIRDYFAAGTQVVWDVDTLGTDVIKVYRAPLADAPQVVYRRGRTYCSPLADARRCPVPAADAGALGVGRKSWRQSGELWAFVGRLPALRRRFC